MIIGTKTNGANPTLIAKTVLSSASSSVIFDRVFTTRFNHYKLICVDMTSDDANTSIRVIRRNVGSDVSTTLDYMGHRGNMESGETTNVMTNQTVGGYIDITADQTGTDGTRHTNHVIVDYFPNVANMPSDMMQSLTIGAGTWYDDAGDGWWHERNHTLIGSTAFDGCKIYGADGNIAGGKFYIFGMV
tara:strand:+ start:480 stop:1043 length:564 start_codon:yes stop_codon:yes gene_type:complete